LRMPALGAAAWAGALVGLHAGGWLLVAGPALATVGLATRPWWWRHRWSLAAWLLLAVAVGTSAGLRDAAVAGGAVGRLAEQRAAVDGVVRITGDPRPVRGVFGERVVVRAHLVWLRTDQGTWRVRSPVLLQAGDDWRRQVLGA